jgi:hypothetical protein
MKAHPFLNIFLPLWVLLAVWQAYFTQLIPDEAYYWVYAQNLAWGYFDHPPMIACMIKAGTLLFNNEWGVRCIITLFSTGTLWLIYKIVEPENEWLFMAIIISIAPLHLLLNFAVPDVPLLFFAALFFFALKRYLQTDGKSMSLLLLIAITGMLYSKYHAVLIIFFTLLAAPRIFRYPSFYFILFATVAYYMPHILWQFNHDLRSVKYHLAERNESSFSLQNSIDYLVGQLVMLGPLAALPLLYSAFKYKIQDAWERVLLFNLAGFLFFFLLMSYRGHIEPNWTVTCWVPLIYLSYNFLQTKTGYWKWLKPISIISLTAVIIMKILLMAPFTYAALPAYNQFHKWRKWAADIKSCAKDKPVIFLNSYQMASEYMFYAHGISFSHNIPYVRGNQFDFWHYEDSILGRNAMMILPGPVTKGDSSVLAGSDILRYKWLTEYWGFGKIRLLALDKPLVMKAGEKYQIRVLAKNLYEDKTVIEKLISFSPDICYLFVKPATFMNPASGGVKLSDANKNDTIALKVTAPAAPGRYALYFSFDNSYKMLGATNSDRMMVNVVQ